MSTPTRAKQGSTMSSKQLAMTVVKAQQITITTSTGDVVSGYLGGMDDFHWMVVDLNADVVLVHKSAPKIEINSGCESYSELPNHTLIEKIVRPFRDSLQEEGLVPPRSSSPVSAT